MKKSDPLVEHIIELKRLVAQKKIIDEKIAACVENLDTAHSLKALEDEMQALINLGMPNDFQVF